MPELSNRQQYERALTAAIATAFAAQAPAVVDGGLPDWMRLRDDLRAAYVPTLRDIYRQSAAGLASRFGLDGSSSTLDRQAERFADAWARQQADAMVLNTRQRVNDAIRDVRRQDEAAAIIMLLLLGIDDPMRFKGGDGAVAVELPKRVDPSGGSATTTGGTIKVPTRGLLGLPRAEGAAITEVTTANSAGEFGGRREIQYRTGHTIVAYWYTEADSKVCPICRPLHGVPEEVWLDVYPMGPPGHPRCRCWLTWEERRPFRPTLFD